MKHELIFSAEELQEFEALEIRGGRGESDYPAQDGCINEALSCGAGITQKNCINKVMGCGIIAH